ncbi:unnamed protein product [Spirodela intermedia]|uniref:Uncharacterized protein n=1 Tax=Spirodela intermedia TaxID=51605 RepID=A0A7I8JGI8_SPIIN|nr:unnamed protein product [Spirodela intermedia]CAA6669250.1 unnamed protein product [Spirodela intermedia]
MSMASKALLGQGRQELDGGGAHVKSFILRFAQQEEALHHIWYALKSFSSSSDNHWRAAKLLSFHSIRRQPL